MRAGRVGRGGAIWPTFNDGRRSVLEFPATRWVRALVCDILCPVSVFQATTPHRRTDYMNFGQRLPRRGIMLAPAAMLLLAMSTGLAQGTINGRVTAQGSGEPLPESRISVVGTNLVSLTAPDGRYALRNVPAGTWVVRVLRVGYQEQKKSVVMTSGQNATLDFTLEAAVVRLDEVVTTATGEQRRVELGNSVSTIKSCQATRRALARAFAFEASTRSRSPTIRSTSSTACG
jgi:hypothetical protein